MQPNLPLLSFLLLPAVLLGCAGNVGSSYTMSSLNEKCDSTGPTGAMVLSATQPKYDTKLTTIDTMMQAPLTISVAYMGGTILCQPAMVAPPGSTVPDAPAIVRVAVAIGFHTGDGAFAEDFEATLLGGVSEAFFSRQIRREDVKGTFDPNLPGYTNVTVAFDGSFNGTSTHGTVGKSGEPSGMVPETFPPVATWDSTK